VNIAADEQSFLRRIPRFSVVIARTDAPHRAAIGAQAAGAHLGNSLADRITAQQRAQTPPIGMAALRVMEGSTVDLALAGGPALACGLHADVRSGYLTVDAGTYDLQVHPAGAACDGLTLLGVTLQAGKIYTVSGSAEAW
jgi:hypothetical protein